MKNFITDFKKDTIFHTFHDIVQFCFPFLNWQQVVIISHNSQYLAIHKLKCHCIKLQQIFDKGNLHGQWAVGAVSQVYKNLRIPFSETEKCNIAAYI